MTREKERCLSTFGDCDSDERERKDRSRNEREKCLRIGEDERGGELGAGEVDDLVI